MPGSSQEKQNLTFLQKMTPQYTNDTISAWLDNTLSDEEAADFETQLDSDTALRERVERLKRERAEQRDEAAAKYRKQFVEWEQENKPGGDARTLRGWIKWAAAAFMVGVLFWTGRMAYQDYRQGQQQADIVAQQRENSIKQAAFVKDSIRQAQEQQRRDSLAALQPLVKETGKSPVPLPDRFLVAAGAMAALPKSEMEDTLRNIAILLKKRNSTAASDEPPWETAFYAFRYDEAHKILDTLPPGRATAPVCQALIKIYHYGTRKECANASNMLSAIERQPSFMMDIHHFMTREEFAQHQAMALAKSGHLTEAAEVLRKYPNAAKPFLR
ncbi:MAG: hypothetical protein IT262_07260 [Saprospiraceae bacterium]|nr:hypothetical protein [Saprospiraceae bacterium]